MENDNRVGEDHHFPLPPQITSRAPSVVTVDARGMACPQPVVLVAKQIPSADEMTVLVDNYVAVQNVSRLADSKGFSVTLSQSGTDYELVLRRTGADASVSRPTVKPIGTEPHSTRNSQVASAQNSGPVSMLITSNCLGDGPSELGERLMSAFLQTLLELPDRPGTIMLMNMGVKLAIRGARTTEELEELVKQGTELLVCGTCLQFFGLTEQLAVGQISNMYTIASKVTQAPRLVKL